MKKFLLSLAAAFALGSGVANAEVASFYVGTAPSEATVSTELSGQLANKTFTAGNVSLEFVKVNTSTTNVNGSLVRWYTNDKMVITPLDGATITSVSMEVGSGYAKTVKDESGATLGAYSGNTWSWNGSISEGQSITMVASVQIRFSSINITYTSAAGIEANAEFQDVIVEAGMGADIVYTPEDLKNVTYVSADESIAKVEEGKVIGVAEGNTTITASWTDGKYIAGEKTFNVTVTKARLESKISFDIEHVD